MATKTTETMKPTYGELIDLLDGSENPDDLKSNFCKLYPHIPIGLRFHDTVSRIAAPTKTSLIGKKLTETQLASYRSRTWEPRIRNKPSDVSFPQELCAYGLNEDLLADVFRNAQMERPAAEWRLNDVPKIEFYRKIHRFLKEWPVTCKSTKSAIGKFYIAIDINFSNNLHCRADNVYRFIEKVCKSSTNQDTLMSYGVNKPISIDIPMYVEMARCTDDLQNLTFEVQELKKQLQVSRKELEESRRQVCSTRIALKDITNQKLVLKKQRDLARERNVNFKETQKLLIEEIAELQEENCDLSKAITDVERELSYFSESTSNSFVDDNFTYKTKCRRRYSPAIRKLYYTLLAEQISTSKIATVIKTIIKSFNPSIDTEELKLPQRSCASYMRRDELKTISAAHKATVLCQDALEKKKFKLNTDGTTKQQKKLGGIIINDTVIAVHELPDGTACTAIKDISFELEKLRKIANDLKLPNANSINWTLFASTVSDSAAVQMKLNRLIDEYREADAEKFGTANSLTVDLVESFCSMHLAVNARKAFLAGMLESELNNSTSTERYHPVDTLVHEFCKLFGKSGVPEYGI